MAQNINIKTLEGLEVKNLSRGWSMEWGEGGSMHCHLYWNGRRICELVQEGNGGCANYWYDNTLTKNEIADFKQAVLTFLKRTDENYNEKGKYEWLRNKTANDINGDDLENVEIILESRDEDVKMAKKAFKNQYKSMCVIDQVYQKQYMSCNCDTVEQARLGLKLKMPELKYDKLILIKDSDNLNIL